MGPFTDYSSTVMACAPRGYWRLGETSGTAAADSSANALSAGTYTGGFTLNQTGALSGDANAAVKLNGLSGYVAVPANTLLDLTTAVSLEAWVKMTAIGGTSEIICKGADANDTGSYMNYLLRVTSTGAVNFTFSVFPNFAVYTTNTTPITAGSWFHLVVTHTWGSKFGVRIYVNGVVVPGTWLAPTTGIVDGDSTPPVTAQKRLLIGAIDSLGSPVNFAIATIDEAAVYNYVLRPGQVWRNYQAGLARFAANTTYYVSLAGSDAANGTSVFTPWQTVSKVNSAALLPGDTVSFQGGSVFSGTLTPANHGSPGAPITYNSYGGGRATIGAGNNDAVLIQDLEYVTIDSLILSGSGVTTGGVTTSTGWGVNLKSTTQVGSLTTSSYYLYGNVVSNCKITGMYGGVLIGSWVANGRVGFNSTRISNNEITLVSFAAIYSWGLTEQAAATPGDGTFPQLSLNAIHANVEIVGNNCHDIYGKDSAAATFQLIRPGSGIRLTSMAGGVVERCIVNNCGHTNDGVSSPAAFEAESSTNITWRANEACYCTTLTGVDGAGFDVMDGGTSGMIAEYNYSHDNDGAAFSGGGAGGATSSGHIIRYNLSVNDHRRSNTGENAQGVFFAFGAITNTNVYRNTFILTGGTTTQHRRMIDGYASSTITFRDNIFAIYGSNVDFQNTAEASHTFSNNLYWFDTGTFAITNSTASYSSLAAWQASGHEMATNGPLGAFGDPKFVGSVASPILLPNTQVANLTACRLQSTSPATGAGSDLVLAGLARPGLDFNFRVVGDSEDIGACQKSADAVVGTAASGGGGSLATGIAVGMALAGR